MPKSKRDKVVHLTQVKKKGKDHKEDLMKTVEQYVAQFKKVYIFDFDQAKSDRVMALRLKLKGVGKIFAGRNSIITVALKTIGLRTNTDFEELIKQVSGHKGLLFTDIECDALVELLDKEQPEFCKKLLGFSHIAPETMAMELDDESGAKAKTTKKKQQKKKKSSEKREVKFVKI